MTEHNLRMHQCPNCDYIVADLQFRYARFDYPCPRCEVKNLSSFKILTIVKPDEVLK
tara:strand:+ start:351 stop:521 length:171 start_codon:yes stop_codon:yes gene_type:complete